MNILQLDVVTVMDIGDVDAHLVILFSLHTTREGHRLSLHLAIGIKSVHGLHTLVGRQNGREAAICIVFELLDSHTSSETATARQLARMIEEIGVSLVVGHTAMVGERIGIAQRHDNAGIGPGACRRWSRAVADVLRHTTCGIQQLVSTFTLRNPRAFGITIFILLAFLALTHHRTTEGLLGHIEATQLTAVGYHVAVQLQVIYLRIAPHEPCLSVVVDHDRRIDMIPRAVLEQGFADSIAERTRRRVADSHTNSHTVRLFRVGTDIPIELAIAFDGLRCPGSVVGPRKALQCQWRPMILPVHHIAG